jgi:pyrroline-5-carboxylate reductase
MSSYTLGFVGAGNMAEAIARGLIAAKLVGPGNIIASDPTPARRELFASFGATATEANADAARADTVLLCVKPQMMQAALEQVRDALDPRSLVISIAAGTTTTYIERALGVPEKAIRVIRAMPNTPMLVGKGATAVCRGLNATEADVRRASELLGAAGIVVTIDDEALMDAVTALSGSGPAYVFFLAEQMISAGVELGLPAETARRLALATIGGAGHMLEASPDSPQELRRKVTSPKGTTHAAITHMQAERWDQITRDAIAAAQRRGRELGK